MSDDMRRQLIAGLVGDREVLYHNSAYFKASIDVLADTLPLWVDGIAARAEAADRQQREALDYLMNKPLNIAGSSQP